MIVRVRVHALVSLAASAAWPDKKREPNRRQTDRHVSFIDIDNSITVSLLLSLLSVGTSGDTIDGTSAANHVAVGNRHALYGASMLTHAKLSTPTIVWLTTSLHLSSNAMNSSVEISRHVGSPRNGPRSAEIPHKLA